MVINDVFMRMFMGRGRRARGVMNMNLKRAQDLGKQGKQQQPDQRPAVRGLCYALGHGFAAVLVYRSIYDA